MRDLFLVSSRNQHHKPMRSGLFLGLLLLAMALGAVFLALPAPGEEEVRPSGSGFYHLESTAMPVGARPVQPYDPLR